VTHELLLNGGVRPTFRGTEPALAGLSIFLRMLRQLDLLDSVNLPLPEPQPSPIALLEQQQGRRKRASRRALQKPAQTWTWGQP